MMSVLHKTGGKGASQRQRRKARVPMAPNRVASVPKMRSGAAAPDLIFGTLATLLGAIGTRALRRWRWLAPLPPVLCNTLIIPFVIRYCYVDVTDSIWFLFATVGAGEILSAGVLGLLLLFALEKHRTRIFKV